MASIRKLALRTLALGAALALLTGACSAAAGASAHATTRKHRARAHALCANNATPGSRAARTHRRTTHAARCRRAGQHAASHKRTRHASGGHGQRGHARGHARSVSPSFGAHSATGCEGATLTPSETNLETIDAATLCLINRERGAHGEQALSANADLQHVAQGHSESMSAQGYFEHVSPDGRTPLARIEASGYIANENAGYEVAENIAWGSLYDATPAAIVAAWMASKGHRENILNPNFSDSGIGVSTRLPASFALGQSGAIYTQDFGAILGG